jgi:hypothetical protein
MIRWWPVAPVKNLDITYHRAPLFRDKVLNIIKSAITDSVEAPVHTSVLE